MLTRKKIVIIEDEPVIIDLLRDVLKKEGCRVFPTTSVQKGVELIDVHRPDVILLDRNMPEMDGIVFLKKLKAARKTKPIPVIMLTGTSESEKIKEAIEAGASGYMIKPFKPSALIEQIEKVLHKEGG